MIAWLASVIGAVVVDALRRPGRIEEHYPETARGEMRPPLGWIALRGRSVTWLVGLGEAVWIEARYLRPIEGNIFDASKLGSIARALKSSRDLTMMAPYGQVHRIDRMWMEESLQFADYQKPWTTGDLDLDRYLQNPEAWLEAAGWHRGEEGAEEVVAELEARVAEAEAAGQGDFGAWTASIRDGNHRAFGAVLGGEERVAVRIYDNDMIDIQEDLRRGRWTGDNDELLRKMIEDSGGIPEWLPRHGRSHPAMLEGLLDPEEVLERAQGHNPYIAESC